LKIAETSLFSFQRKQTIGKPQPPGNTPSIAATCIDFANIKEIASPKYTPGPIQLCLRAMKKTRDNVKTRMTRGSNHIAANRRRIPRHRSIQLSLHTMIPMQVNDKVFF
jgi:hypothetical protein